MSRVPRPAKSYSNMRSVASPAKQSAAPAIPATPSRLRVPSGGRSRPSSPSKPIEEPKETPTPKLSLKEQIALKRQEAKKAALAEQKKVAGVSSTFDDAIDAIPDSRKKPVDDPDNIGRWGVRETIERARSTGKPF